MPERLASYECVHVTLMLVLSLANLALLARGCLASFPTGIHDHLVLFRDVQLDNRHFTLVLWTGCVECV